MAINSYAQNFEDVMLWRALSHVEHGFYIDVGAQDPVIDSVSLAFHELGWQGIHIEPIPRYADALRQQRPGDQVLQTAIGNGPSAIQFYEIKDTGLSTADSNIAVRHQGSGFETREIVVPCIPLSAVFDSVNGREIHWLKIDVEGFEREVLDSWAPSKARPWIVVIESTLPLTQVETHLAWEHVVLGLGYDSVYFDGLNRYYLSRAHGELKGRLSVPPNTFDGFTLNGTASAPFHRKIEAQREQQIKAAEHQRARLEQEQQTERTSFAAREESLRLRLQEAGNELLLLKSQLSEKEAEFVSNLASVKAQAQRELKEQDSRHSTALTERELILETLRTRLREKVDQLVAAQSLSLHQAATFEDSARSERKVAAAREDRLVEQLSASLADARKLTEALEMTRGELHAIKNTWMWRLFGPADSSTLSSAGAELQKHQADFLTSPVSTESAASLSTKTPSMNNHFDPSKPARSVDELLNFNDYDFVNCAYLSVLGRPADAEGLANYVRHVRAGADRLELVLALATSPEGVSRDPALFVGLAELLRRGSRRPSYVSRHIVGPVSRALRSLFARVDVSEYRLGKIEDSIRLQFEAIEQRIKLTGSSHGKGFNIGDEEQLAVDKLSPHARSIYFQFKDRAANGKLTP